MTSLAAAWLDSRLGYVGLGLTLVAARFSYYAAFVVAVVHVAVVLAYGGADWGELPTVAAGLLGGMLITPWAASAALTWVIVAVASTVTLFELDVSLWFALIPLAIISTVLSLWGVYMERWQTRTKTTQDIESSNFYQRPRTPTQRTLKEWDDLFV